MYRIVISTVVLFLISGCSNHRILKVKAYDSQLIPNQKMCYQLSDSQVETKKIFGKNYLDKASQSSDSYFEYSPYKILSNIVSIKSKCDNNVVIINNIEIFDKYYSDTAQWEELFFVAIDISYQGDEYKLDNVRFKDYESTGWLYAFKFPNVNKKYVGTINRALVRIFTDIEDAITNKLTLEQRNAKKDKERLETEQLMDKYIKVKHNKGQA